MRTTYLKYSIIKRGVDKVDIPLAIDEKDSFVIGEEKLPLAVALLRHPKQFRPIVNVTQGA